MRGIPADLPAIFRELSRLPKSLDELPRRIALCRQALSVVDKETDAPGWAHLQIGLAQALAQSPQGPRAENLEEAIMRVNEALKVFTRQAYPQEWAATQHNLATAYLERKRGERADNLERALEHYTQAFGVFTREAHPEDWALAEMNLTALYEERLRGERAENLEQAIEHGRNALQVYTRQAYPEWWAGTLNNLAIAYIERQRGDRAENLEQAIDCGTNALQVYTREAYPEDWAMTNHTLGNAYRNRIRGDKAENLEQAIEHYQQTLKVRTRQAYPELWALTQNALGVVYSERVLGTQTENLRCALNHYKGALTVRTRERSPANFQQTQCNIGLLYFGSKQWGKALAAYREAIDAEKMLLTAAYTEAGRQAEVARTSAVYANGAYALLELGRPGEALIQLEQGKTRLLSRALALNEVDLSVLPAEQQEAMRNVRQTIRMLEAEMRLPPDTPARLDDRTLAQTLEQARAQLNKTIETVRRARPDFMPEGLELAEILGLIPKDAALVAPVITSQGSAVLVLPHGTAMVTKEHIVELDRFTRGDLLALLRGPSDTSELGGWLGAYYHYRSSPTAWFRKPWFEAIEASGQELWKVLLGPVHERLKGFGLKEGAPILLMPQGGLGLLPLHAAWRIVEGKKRSVLDDWTVVYLPNGYALSVSRERLKEPKRQGQALLPVINPTKDLPFTPSEGQAVMALFTQALPPLEEDAATVAAVERAASAANYLHFSCHASYNWQDPMQSGLGLADGELSLAKIITDLDLSACRMVTLSACETGLTDIRQPDEFLGLPTGFLQAGAPAVISTLWPVNDLSTMLLMERFHQNLLGVRDGKTQSPLPPAAALREAQIWLRDVTAGELAQHPGEIGEIFKEFSPEQTRYSHPYHWAAFTFSGV